MKQEALETFPKIRKELEAVVLDILEDEPEGVRTRKMMFRLNDHTELSFHVSPKHTYVWMAELKRDGVIVIDNPGKRYLHPKHVDLESEKYRPGGRPLDVSLRPTQSY